MQLRCWDKEHKGFYHPYKCKAPIGDLRQEMRMRLDLFINFHMTSKPCMQTPCADARAPLMNRSGPKRSRTALVQQLWSSLC